MEIMKYYMIPLITLLAGCQDKNPDLQSSHVGRYTIVHSPHNQMDTVLLDTATGKTWVQVTYEKMEGEPMGWEPMAREDSPEEYNAFMARNRPKPDEEK